ncbi:XPG i-region domain-containing protein [Trichoderma breve]|uniref:XPG i-region domain-containing protein n=1 Tax=Trichoderma breve TaxID=2034170 RepID=A0A9W9B9C8_9HYPO|nr:XPG i-region domain-containing protein [Trichoderma breve]KAJ4858359.1 XPG i-region domain-containing protein [Trichoderma breve]
MGIKGIYRELGPGKRISLSKLASDSFVEHNRPYRLAIDIAIWQFQNQAARGGTNPAIRTLFYRLVRLLGTPIQPIFVFDGPNKPKFKLHDAPGEAEAECAFLQKNGIVDAVLSEDVDTIMFGCTRTLRNWSAEGKNGKPTHVSMYDVNDLNMANLGLDREGMVLVALMSGGDYIPEGVPGCGPKVAYTEGLRQWKKSLTHELRTNASKYFRTRHKALDIPEDFPNVEVLRYYTHPVVSPESTLEVVRQRLKETREIQLDGLREFTRETFNWDFRIGAIKFIRVLSEGLFVNRMYQDGVNGDAFVKKISARRNHFSTDSTSELRLAYIPEEIVPIDISNEVEEEITYARSGLALNSDEEFGTAPDNLEDAQGGVGKTFDITKPELTWVLEEVARRFAPRSVQAWEEGKKQKSTKKKATTSKTKKDATMPHGAIDSFVRITKAVETQGKATNSVASDSNKDDSEVNEFSEPDLPPLPQPSQLRRPQTPPSLRRSSKQPMPNAPPSLDRWTVTSSPDPTRRHDDAGVFEAIVISSSPTGSASPPSRSLPSSPITTTTSASRNGEMPKSIRSILAAGASSRQKTSSHHKTSQGAIELRQMSMDMSTEKLPQSETSRPGSSKSSKGSIYNLNSSREDITTKTMTKEVEIILSSSPEVPRTSRPTTSKQRTRIPPPQRNNSPGPAPGKKIYVPNGAGFFKEIEVNEDEYEERISREVQSLQDRGIRAGVTRWSDVSFIDLTDAPNS